MTIHRKLHDKAEVFSMLSNNSIQNIEEMKHFGAVIDHKFHWERHTPYLSCKVENLCDFKSMCRNNYKINTDTVKIIEN